MILIIIMRRPGFKSRIVQLTQKIYFFFIILFIFSVITPFVLTTLKSIQKGSLYERKILIEAAIVNISNNPIFGAGLGNANIMQYYFMPKNLGLVTHEPVHNIYLLIISELGFAGFVFLLAVLYRTAEKINRINLINFLPLLHLISLGFLDHYFLTLQQGMLMLVVFASLVNWNKK